MEETTILVTESLQETLWRLEEVHLGFRPKSRSQVQKALNWLLSRQGLAGSYCNLFMPTPRDLAEGARLPTGEHVTTNAATKHILGEEALRTAIVWKQETSHQLEQALEGFNQLLHSGAKKTGTYCCYNCTIAFLRTLVTAKPKQWDQVLQKGLNAIKKARTPDGRWHGYPFYYTLLFLSDVDSLYAKEELKHAKKAAEKLANKYRRNDRISLFRNHALEAALSAEERHKSARP